MTDARELSAAKRAAIDGLFSDLPTTYPEIRFQLTAMREAVHENIAKSLEPQLNQFLRDKELNSFSDYQNFAQSIDEILTNLGLCISMSGEPALLIVQGSALADDLHFSVLTCKTGKPGYQITALSSHAPTLKLMTLPDNAGPDFEVLRDRAYSSRARS